MIKDKLHTITDADAIEVALILLKGLEPYVYEFKKITRINYDIEDGTDAEESVNVYFDAKLTSDLPYKEHGWEEDFFVKIELIESDRYHDYPYFVAFKKNGVDSVWKYRFISNHIEATQFLMEKGYL